MNVMSWVAAAGVALAFVLAFLAGNSLETYRVRRLLRRIAQERHDLEEEWQELDQEWQQLEEQRRALQAEQAAIRVRRPDERRRPATLG